MVNNEKQNRLISSNKQAHHDYFLSSFIECGIVLTGTEIKSLRKNGCSLKDSYVKILHHEAFILGMHIAKYEQGTIYNHDENRSRKLLLHKNEILKLENKVMKEGYTLIATKVYLVKGRCKVEIALAKGKKLYDKREDEKKLSIEKNLREIKNERNY